MPNADAANQLCFQLKNEFSPAAIVLGFVAEEKPGLAIYLEESLLAEKSWNASQLVRDCGKFIQGGGGGQAFFATAGGKDITGIPKALNHAKTYLGL